MYIIVTTSSQLAQEARKQGVIVTEYKETIETSQTTKISAITKEKRTNELLRQLSIKPSYRGYGMFKYIFNQCLADPRYHKLSKTQVIYPECAKLANSTVAGAERNLRHALQRSYEDETEVYVKLFNYKLDRVPRVGEFISMASEYLNSIE